MKLKDGNYLIGMCVESGTEPMMYIVPHRHGVLGAPLTVSKYEFDRWMNVQGDAAEARKREGK